MLTGRDAKCACIDPGRHPGKAWGFSGTAGELFRRIPYNWLIGAAGYGSQHEVPLTIPDNRKAEFHGYTNERPVSGRFMRLQPNPGLFSRIGSKPDYRV
jgi:hypothetical protein